MTTEHTPNFGLALPDFRMGPWHDLVNGNTMTIDALLYSALSNTNVVAWTNATLYNSGVSVVDNDNATIWLCLHTHTSAAFPTTFAEDRAANPTFWTQLIAGFAPRGEWQNNTDYFPYDMAFSSTQGIFALCMTRHTSNTSGTLKDDEAYWAFLFDMSEAEIGSALAVTYTPTAPITGTNVQDALDQLAGFVVALNNINIEQGTDIDALEAAVSGLDTRIDALETLTASQGTLISNLDTRLSALETQVNDLSDAVLRIAANQTIGPGGFSAPAKDWGNKTGTLALNPKVDGNYQGFNNVGAITITAPTVDCGIDLLMTNGSGAVAPSFSGFTVAAGNTGDTFTTTAGHKFLISIRRLLGTSTYAIKALQ